MDQIIGREGETATLAETMSAAVTGSPRFLVLERPPGMPLSGLDAESVARLIAERLGKAPAAEFAAQCLAATGGNPLLLRHLLQTLAATGTAPSLDAAGQPPLRGEALIASQLKRLVEPANGSPAPPGPANMRAHQRRPEFGPAALTAHERRLIAMAMAGQTNNEIAGRFGVSRRAVEFHFTHIYRKLGITRRPQLHQFATLPITQDVTL